MGGWVGFAPPGDLVGGGGWGGEDAGIFVGPQRWAEYAALLRRWGREGYGEGVGGTAVASLAPSTLATYAGHLRGISEGGGCVREYLAGLAALGRTPACLRAAMAAVALCRDLGLEGGVEDGMARRMCIAARKQDRRVPNRPYAGERHLEVMASACTSESHTMAVAAAVFSFALLLRVGEVANLR